MTKGSALVCPVCGGELEITDKRAFCAAGHSFDRAKEGYFYLITRAGYSLSGDSPEAVMARRDFLMSGCYASLAEALLGLGKKYGKSGMLLTDTCCGEGYYSGYIKNHAEFPFSVTGFDLSKTAVRLAAKAYPENLYYTANISAIPQKDTSADILLHSFAPVHNAEFARILKPSGVFIDVIPAKRHLWELKKVLYEKPYENDEKSSVGEPFVLTESIRTTDTVTLDESGIKNVLYMTPYAYKTPKEAISRLLSLKTLKTETGFVINVYGKTGSR